MPALKSPSTLAPIQAADFTVQSNMGLSVTQFESGNSRVRKRFKTMPNQQSLTFVMEYRSFGDWMAWINDHGHEWFNIEMPNQFAAAAGAGICGSMADVRIISDVTWSIIGDHVKAVVATESRQTVP